MLARLTKASLLACVFAAAAVLSAQAPSKFDRTVFEDVRKSLQEGQFSRAVSLLEPFTSPATAAPAPLYLLGLVRLQEGSLGEVDRVLERLRTRPSPEAASYIDKLQPVLESARKNETRKADFAAAVRNLDARNASSVLEEMDLPPAQRLIVSVYMDTMRGRLTSAAASLQSAAGRTLPSAMSGRLTTDVTLLTSQFRDLSEQLRWYHESALGSSSCGSVDARERSAASGFALGEYVRLSQLAMQLFPFNERFMDSAFLGSLLASPYGDLEQLGDTILRAKGTLRIPFYSASARMTLVIDSRKKRISTELDAATLDNVTGTEDLGTHVLFDLPFSEVTGISQKARNWPATGGIARDSYALRLSPSGQVPHYLFMSLVHCLYGEETQKAITRNLGLFVQHVVGDGRRIQVSLEDPTRVTRDRLQIFSQIVGTSTYIAASVAAQVPQPARPNDGRMSADEILASTAQEGQTLATRRNSLLKAQDALAQTQRESRRTWSESLADTVLNRDLSDITTRVEELLALVEIR